MSWSLKFMDLQSNTLLEVTMGQVAYPGEEYGGAKVSGHFVLGYGTERAVETGVVEWVGIRYQGTTVALRKPEEFPLGGVFVPMSGVFVRGSRYTICGVRVPLSWLSKDFVPPWVTTTAPSGGAVVVIPEDPKLPLIEQAARSYGAWYQKQLLKMWKGIFLDGESTVVKQAEVSPLKMFPTSGPWRELDPNEYDTNYTLRIPMNGDPVLRDTTTAPPKVQSSCYYCGKRCTCKKG